MVHYTFLLDSSPTQPAHLPHTPVRPHHIPYSHALPNLLFYILLPAHYLPYTTGILLHTLWVLPEPSLPYISPVFVPFLSLRGLLHHIYLYTTYHRFDFLLLNILYYKIRSTSSTVLHTPSSFAHSCFHSTYAPLYHYSTPTIHTSQHCVLLPGPFCRRTPLPSAVLFVVTAFSRAHRTHRSPHCTGTGTYYHLVLMTYRTAWFTCLLVLFVAHALYHCTAFVIHTFTAVHYAPPPRFVLFLPAFYYYLYMLFTVPATARVRTRFLTVRHATR